ncbi:putative bacteriocin export ABC transporter [Enterococcus faecium]|nr:putative bacteriocin export ABC transporter [Enterococcus faecium]EGP5426772.1 ATP-binding cassette domain-containing protein [Enterococcus faecium]ELI7153581.1 putative bacteriocin export ABC transporter [Enterococcus faecium]EME8185569.1 putative bacteriocin export ABC transporter [Enterococcus faecium]EME8237314.1 putative bacteriocin export ABC transporter [Enterococcus faecium]
MPLIQLDHVTKTYKQKLVLDAVSLSIDQGEFWTIHGKSGAGKSTLLNLLGLIDSFDEGTVSLFGKSAPKINSKAALLLRRNKISYLFQNHGLIEDETIMDNLNIPFIYRKTIRREKIKLQQEALAKVSLDYPLKTKVYRLSGGEKQRLAFAKLLLEDKELILADEPTGSLDNENRNHILDLLFQQHRAGKTVIVVTHDPYIIEKSPRSFSIDSWQETKKRDCEISALT